MKNLSILFLLLFTYSCSNQPIKNERSIASTDEEMVQDVKKIKERFYYDYQISGSSEEIKIWKIEDIKNWIALQRADGTWPDVNYKDVNDVKFPPAQHTARMQYLSMAYATSGHPYSQNAAVLAAAKRAFDHWIKNDYQSYNWWNNEIGVPGMFQRTMILLEKNLSAAQMSAGLKILDRASLDKTGQNLLWYAETVLVRSLFTNKFSDTTDAVKAIQSLIVYSTQEGVRTDKSFHQHGPLIYSGGYGLQFSQTMARIVGLTNGTFAELSKDKLAIISSYILDGQYWTVRNNKFDYGVIGRTITRKDANAKLLGDACKKMAQYNLARDAEFESCAVNINGNKTSSLFGNKMFWISDMMVHHRPKFYTSARMYSSRTLNNDAPSNGEGLLSHHLADGATFIMKDGSEYENIFPVWDWTKIPGATIEQKKLKPAVYSPGHNELFAHIRYFGQSKFVGGATDGVNGVAAMDFVGNKTYEKLDAKKAWFYFDQGFIAVGNSIKCPGCLGVVTTLDQSYLKGEVITNKNGEETSIAPGEYKFSDLDFILHNNTAFFFPRNHNIGLKVGEQQGNWKRISEQLDASLVKADVFTAWIDHGAEARTSEYQYIVMPGLSYEEASKVNINRRFYIYNTDKIQAVNFFREQMIQAVFYEPAVLNMGDIIIESKSPAILIYSIKDKRIYISDPTHLLKAIKIVINGQLYTVNLPQGELAGSSVSIDV